MFSQLVAYQLLEYQLQETVLPKFARRTRPQGALP